MDMNLKQLFFVFILIGASLPSLFSEEIRDGEIEELYEMSLEELMNVEIIVVSATKSSQKVKEAPAVVTVITDSQIRYRGYSSVAEALMAVPGVDILSDHLKYNAGVRGVNGGMRAWSRIVKLMIDGQPVSFRSSSENWLGEELIPIDTIERIEIIRGPASALYGANAFLGVINIITKKGRDVEFGSLSAKLGFVQKNFSYGSNGVAGSSYGNFDLLASFSMSRTDRSGLSPESVLGKTTYSSEEISENDMSQPQSFFAKASYETKAMGIFAVDFNYQRLNSYGAFQDWSIASGKMSNENHIALDNFYIRGKYRKSFFEKLDSSLFFAYSHGGPSQDEKLDDNRGVGDQWVTRDFGYLGLDAGAEFKYSLNRSILFQTDYSLKKYRSNLRKNMFSAVLF